MSSLLHKSHRVFYFILGIIMLSFPSLSYSTSAKECGSKAGSSDYCVCSLSSAIASIISIVKGPDVESHLASFECPNFIQLPESLTKAEEIPLISVKNNQRHHSKSSEQDAWKDHEVQVETAVVTEPGPAPVQEIYEFPRYTKDSEGNIRGPRYRRIRRETFFQFPAPLELKHHRSKRQVQLGVPTEIMFSNAIAKMPSPREQHQYVPLGSSATLQCFTKEKQSHFKKWPNKKFTWTYFDGRPVTTSQMSVDQKTGELTIYAVQLQDTDLYNCTVDILHKNTGKIEMTETFSHQIDVISEPAFWLQLSVNYITNSDSCFPVEIYQIEKSISSWVHAYICENCEVRNITVMCEHSEEEIETKILIQMIVTTMGIESKIPSLKFGTEYSCPLTCSEKLHLKLLEIIGKSLTKLFLRPIMLIDQENGEQVWYESLGSSLSTKIIEGCLSGFYQTHKLCFPCDIGKYSPNGNADCILCPTGSYQNKQGSSGCVQCGSELTTLTTGSTTEFSCIIPSAVANFIIVIQDHWVLAICFFVIISLTLKIIIFLYWFPESKITEYIKAILCCGCCFPNRSASGRKSGYRKLKRRSSLLLTTETNSNTDASSDSDLSNKHLKNKGKLHNQIKSLKGKGSQFVSKAKRKMRDTLSATGSKINALGADAGARLKRSFPKKSQSQITFDDEKTDATTTQNMRLKNLIPVRTKANDGLIEQLKGLKSVRNNLRPKFEGRENDLRV